MRSCRTLALLAIAAAMTGTSLVAQTAAGVDALLKEPSVAAAIAAARANEPGTVEDQVRFCQVPAPPFKEAARAEVLRRAFVELGLDRVRVDSAGNVLGERGAASARPHVVIAAHLDTVFPEGTPVQVTREGAVMKGPGIGDNCRGLAVLTAIVHALRQGGVKTPGRLTFVANVGEEGLGDLRGVKAVFDDPANRPVDRFMSIDGGGLHITTVGVGSLRYRVTFKGPGGHSFAAFGLANPVGALGRAVARINELRVPEDPKTTFNVGRIGGGTSVNSIPYEAWMEVDLRSSDRAALAALDARFHSAVDGAVVDENRRWGSAPTVSVTKELVGNRPAGSTPTAAPIVQTAQAVGRALGLTVPLSQGSTDSNVPMSLRIPAITIGGGGRGADAHALSELFDATDSWRGTQNAVLLAIALAHP